MAVSTGLLVATAAYRLKNVNLVFAHLAVAATMSTLFASRAIQDCREMLEKGATASAVAASNAYYMGLVWSWGALVLIATYATGILVWKEWWHFVIAFIAAAALSLYFSAKLSEDARSGTENPKLLAMSRRVAIFQLACMVITMAGLVVDGKMIRYLNPRYTDWAANNVFFFGALAIAVISGYALKANKHA